MIAMLAGFFTLLAVNPTRVVAASKVGLTPLSTASIRAKPCGLRSGRDNIEAIPALFTFDGQRHFAITLYQRPKVI
jgi:hypothetical protein